jgi:hypothetical protein
VRHTAPRRPGANECRERNREAAVGVAHVGLHSSDQAVGDHAYDTEEQAEAHASAGEEEGGEEHAPREVTKMETALRDEGTVSGITLTLHQPDPSSGSPSSAVAR